MVKLKGDLLLTTSEVAELLSVHPSTVKRWCNEGVLGFHKTEGGHRRVHLHNALDVAAKRDLPTYLTRFAPYEGHVWSAIHDVVTEGSFWRVHSLALGWLVRGHADRVGELFHELGRHPQVSLVPFIEDGVRGFMRLVGEEWAAGRLRVGEEHLVTQSVLEALLRLREARAGQRARGRERGAAPACLALVGAFEGDHHHVGALCIRLLLEDAGWDVRYLGPSVPLDEFSALQRSAGADLVAISFSPPRAAADMKRAIALLSSLPTERPFALALGGSLPDLDDIGATGHPFRALGVFGSTHGFVEWLAETFPEPRDGEDSG